MIKYSIAFMALIMLISVTAQAGYFQNNGGFTVTTIALDAENVEIMDEQAEEDTNASVEGEISEK